MLTPLTPAELDKAEPERRGTPRGEPACTVMVSGHIRISAAARAHLGGPTHIVVRPSAGSFTVWPATAADFRPYSLRNVGKYGSSAISGCIAPVRAAGLAAQGEPIRYRANLGLDRSGPFFTVRAGETLPSQLRGKVADEAER